MRISDWSSDVCSSDLVAFDDLGEMRDLGAIGLRITIEEEILERCARCAVLAPGLDRVFVDVARSDEAPRAEHPDPLIVTLARTAAVADQTELDRKSTRLNSSH